MEKYFWWLSKTFGWTFEEIGELTFRQVEMLMDVEIEMMNSASRQNEKTSDAQPTPQIEQGALVRAPVTNFEMRSYTHPEEYTQLHPSIPFFISKKINKH